MGKKCGMHTHTLKYYSSLKNMDGPRDYHTKQSQKEKDKYFMISLICGI